MKWQLITLALTSLLTCSVMAQENWQLKEAPSGFGAKWLAEVKNQDGDTLKVYRKVGRSGYEAFAELTLASGKSFNDQMPNYQIDKGKIEDTAVIKRAGDVLNRNWAELKNNQANWRIWASTEKNIQPTSDLTPWMQGNTLVIRYKDKDNKEKQTSFSLSGSSRSINTAISGAFQ